MKKAAQHLFLAVSVASVLVTPVHAGVQRKPPTVSPPSPSADRVDRIALGYRLADHARLAGDARAMIVAARIVGAVPAVVEAVPGAPAVKPMDGAALLTEARQLARGDQSILSEIESAEAQVSKGVGCPSIRGCGPAPVRFVPPQTVWTLRFMAKGGEPLVVGARRDAQTPIVLRIFDENGNLVCQDLSRNVTLYCRVNPIWTGPYEVKLANEGDIGTGVTVVTN